MTSFWIVVNHSKNKLRDATMSKVFAMNSLILLIIVLAAIIIIAGEQTGLVMA